MLSIFVVLLAADVATAAPVTQPLVEPDPKSMTQREIRAYNATLPNGHPFHIRCVRSVETGSLVKATYSCRTIRQWSAADESGNRNARETYEAMQGKATTGN